MKDVLLGLVAVLFIGAFIYGGYWVAKNVSYAVFYEDMVTDTIIETVKPNCINK